jgi:predicted Zn finger-like uncharacterized protein
MFLDAECPHCHHQYKIDSGYLGIKRMCPECGEKFVFETADGKEAHEFGGPQRIGCPSCFQIGGIPAAYDSEQMVACGVCSTQIPRQRALDFVRVLSEAESLAKRHLLAGAALALIDALVDLGIPRSRVDDFVIGHQERLPMTRFAAVWGDDRGDFVLDSDGRCDLCEKALDSREKRTPCRALWQKTQQGDPMANFFVRWFMSLMNSQSFFPVFDVREAEEAKSASSEHEALYYLCASCRDGWKDKDSLFYHQYPGTEGFVLKKLVATEFA